MKKNSNHSMGRTAVSLIAATAGLGMSAMSANAQTRPSADPDSSARIQQLNDRLDEADRQIESLRREVQHLRAPQTRPSTPTTAPSRVTIAAEPAIKPLPKMALISGYDGHHFFIGSPDGNFKLSFEGQIDVRYDYTHRREPDDGDQDTQGFQLRHAKLGMRGYIGDPKFTFRLRGAFDRDGGAMELDDAWVAYQFTKELRVKAGQFDGIFMREFNISSKYQQAAERSAVARYFYDESTKGIMVNYDMARLHNTAMLTSGPDQGGADFDTSSHHYEWVLTGRTDVLIAGNWKQFEDYAAWSKQPFGLMAGGGVSWNKGAHYSGADNPDLLQYTADLSAKFPNGLNLMAAFIGQHVSDESGSPRPDGDQIGLVMQGGFFILPDRLDLFARYAWADLKGAAVDIEDDTVTAIHNDIINTITVGTNYYFRKHNAKLTFDVVYALDPIDEAFSSTATGLLPDTARGELVFRTQFQLLF